MLKRTTYFTAFCIALIVGMSFSEGQAQMQEEKIGYVNPQAILQKMPEMKAVQQRMQNFIQKKREDIADQNQKLEQQIQEYSQKQSVMSEQAKKKEEERLGKLQADMQTAQRDAQQAIQEKQQELVGPLYSEINKGIDAVAKRMGLSYVLNTTTTNGDIIILYASQEAQNKYDITDQVMAELGIGS